MKRIIHLLSILPLAMVLTACPKADEYYLDPVFEAVEASQSIPQGGTVITAKVDWIQTKHAIRHSYKPVEIVASIDGEAFYHDYDYNKEKFTIPVPENDSYSKRNVTIKARAGKNYVESLYEFYAEKASWEEWQTLYTGVQECLDNASSTKYPDFSGYRIVLSDGSLSARIDPSGNATAECFMRLVFDKGTYTEEMGGNYVYQNTFIETENSAYSYEDILSMIPVNATAVPSGKGIYLDNAGCFCLVMETGELEYYRYSLSPIGTVVSSDVASFDAMFPSGQTVVRASFTLEKK